MHCLLSKIHRCKMRQVFSGIKALDALSNVQDSQVHNEVR